MSGDPNVEQPNVPAFDSTQTVRAVTVRELRDPNQQKWFAVQLAVSDRPVNLEALPRFDVFASHNLYAVQGRLGAAPCYALRLGFFQERELARTICVDLQAFYRSASVVQVSAAEQARFEKVPSPQLPAQKPMPTSAADPSPPKTSANTIVLKTATQAKPGAAAQRRRKLKSLSQELLEEARQIELASSARHSTNQQNTSWLSRLFGRSND